jgi:ribosome-associated translation inhibitor RaiA
MSADPSDPTIDVVARGAEAERAAAVAEEKVRRVIGLVGAPVLRAEVKLGVEPNPAIERPALAQAMLDVNGTPLRAQVAGENMPDAIDMLEERLRDQVNHRAERLRSRRRGRVEPGDDSWQRGRGRTPRAPWYDRPAEEREVVRRKAFDLRPATLDEAVFDLESLDHDFLLFREASTGDDALLARGDDGGYRLRRLGDPDAPTDAHVATVHVEPAPAPELAFAEAIEWLELADDPFVLFRDRDTATAKVLYRRYDGHYGVIAAA